jgi:murein DD-endopeptidase MepM/ murein hydrolase activator NlpD
MRRRAAALAPVLLALVAPAWAAAADHAPKAARVQCVTACAGAHRVAPGSTVRWEGRHLAAIKSVRFSAHGGRENVDPTASRGNFVTARVPHGAVTGRPVLVGSRGQQTYAKAVLSVVSRHRVLSPNAFGLLHSRARPHTAFFDGHQVRISFRFAARGPRDVKVKMVRASTGAVVDSRVLHQVTPFAKHVLRWTGTRGGRSIAPAGAYEVRIGRPGHRGTHAGHFKLFPFEFPVRGSHSYGGAEQRFGAPRSGGRVHQGQDVLSPCGTREVAARGGRVQAEGYDPVLYGYWLVIDGRHTRTDYRYAHLEAPTPVARGRRVRTGQTVGHVGRTGNARTIGCMLHFEEWPRGWENGSPIDPLPDLERWDRWS